MISGNGSFRRDCVLRYRKFLEFFGEVKESYVIVFE